MCVCACVCACVCVFVWVGEWVGGWVCMQPRVSLCPARVRVSYSHVSKRLRGPVKEYVGVLKEYVLKEYMGALTEYVFLFCTP